METRLTAEYDYHFSRGAVLVRLLKIKDALSIRDRILDGTFVSQ